MNTKSNLTLIWLLSYISIASVSAAMITPALPYIEHEFGLTSSAVEGIVSAFLIGYVVGQLIYGPLANSFGRLKALTWGLNINILGIFLCLYAGFYHNYPVLLLGRLVCGLGSAAGLTCTFMLINEWLPESKRKAAMAYSILSFALGNGLSVMIGGVISQYVFWQACFLFLLIQGVIMRMGLQVFDETLKHPKKLHLFTLVRDYANALRSFKLTVFSLIWGTTSAIGYCYSASAPNIANQFLHLSVSSYGFWNALNIIGMLVGGLSARVLLQRFSVIQVITLGFTACFLGLFSLYALYYTESQSTLWFFLSTATLFCFSSYIFAGGSYMASNAIEDRASASSMMSFINMSVATLSVIIMSYIATDPFSGFLHLLTGVFCITFSLLILFVIWAKSQPTLANN